MSKKTTNRWEGMVPSPKRPGSEAQAANEESVQSALPEVAMPHAERASKENAGDVPDANED